MRSGAVLAILAVLVLLGSPASRAADTCPAGTLPCACPSGESDLQIEVLEGTPPALKICNCQGASQTRAFVRAARTEPNDPAAVQYTERLLKPTDLAVGVTTCWNLALAPVGNDGVISAWVRFRTAPSGESVGTILATKVAELAYSGIDNDIEPLSVEGRASLEARLPSELEAATQGSPLNPDCPGLNFDIAHARYRNLSPFATLGSVVHAKYACSAIPRNAYQVDLDTSSPLEGVCQGSQPPVACHADSQCGQAGVCNLPPDLNAKSTEDSFSRETLGPGACQETHIKLSQQRPQSNFPFTCDCPRNASFCAGGIHRAAIFCAGVAVTEVTENGERRRVGPALWSEYSSDIDVKKTSEEYTTADAKFDCENFASWNSSPVGSYACTVVNSRQDADNDRIFDSCDRLVTSIDTVAGGGIAELKPRIRNEYFDGGAIANGCAGPDSECFPTGSIAGVTVNGVAVPQFTEGTRLTLVLPDQEHPSTAGEGALQVVVIKDVEGWPTEFPVTVPLHSRRVSFAGISPEEAEQKQTGLLLGLESEDGDLFDLRTALDTTVVELDGSSAVTGIAVGAKGRIVAINRTGELQLQDLASQAGVGGGLEYTEGAGRGVAVENEVEQQFNRYVYAAEGNTNGKGGRILVVDLEDPQQFLTNAISIGGDPREVEVRLRATAMIAYVLFVGKEGCLEPGARPLLLAAIDVDRGGDFANPVGLQAPLLLGCVDGENPPEHYGLAWNEDRSVLYATVPSMALVAALPLALDGSIEASSRVDIATRQRPADLTTTRCIENGLPVTKLAVVALGKDGSSDPTVGPGLDLVNVGSETVGVVASWPFAEADSRPVSVTAHPAPEAPNGALLACDSATGPVVIVADDARHEVRVVRIGDGTTARSLATSVPGAPRRPARLATQRRYPSTTPLCPATNTCGAPNQCQPSSSCTAVPTGLAYCKQPNGSILSCDANETLTHTTCACQNLCTPACLCAYTSRSLTCTQ